MLQGRYPQSICLFLVLILFLSTPAHARYPDDVLDKKALIQLLRDQQYNRLEMILTDLQSSYEQGRKEELEVAHAFGAYANSDPELESRFNAWLKHKPDSYAAHLALAEYNLNIGWLARGGRWAKDTQQKQFAKMEAYFRVAAEEYSQALRINPKLTLAYSGMIRVSYALGGGDISKQIMQKGLEIDPVSLAIHYNYLWSLQPKWGGSMAAMQQHLSTLRPYYNDNPRLRNLEAFPDLVLADQYRWPECEKATPFLNQALEKGQLSYVYKKRGYNQRCLKNYEAAIAAFTTAIRLNPQSADYLQARGYTFFVMKDYQNALKDLDEAIELDRMRPKALRYRGMVYYKLNQTNAALQDLNDALIYGNEDKKTHLYLGYVYYYQKKSYAMAARHLQESIKLGESHPFTRYLHTAALWHERDYSFVSSAKEYVRMCENNRKCKSENVEWARNSMDHASANGICR